MAMKEQKIDVADWEVSCKRSNTCFRDYTSKTILINDKARNLSAILNYDATRVKNFCGIADYNNMVECRGEIEKVLPNTIDNVVTGIICTMKNDPNNYSLYRQILSTDQPEVLRPEMVAHHISGNHYDHRLVNGIALKKRDHYDLHHHLNVDDYQDYGSFIDLIASLHHPGLLKCYETADRSIRFQTGSDNQMKEAMILEFFGSDECYDWCWEVILDKIKDQIEKEIHFDLIH